MLPTQKTRSKLYLSGNMNFIELVRLKNQLDILSMQDIGELSQQRFQHIIHQTNLGDSGIEKNYHLNLADKNETLQHAFQDFEKAINEFKDEVKIKVEQEGKFWLQKSLSNYEKQLETKLFQQPESVDLHKNKILILDNDTRTVLHSRVAAYCDWHYNSMILHPTQEGFIDHMVGSDILYVLDENMYLLDPVLEKFNPTYRSRLRVSTIEESFDESLLSAVPDNQIAFCLVYNYLNYKPFEMIQKYLTEIYEKLTPGGVAIITYNDCDRYQAIQMVEQEITCYTPASLVMGWIDYLGFEEVFRHQDTGPSVWLELKKPGKLKSLKGGQTLAKILPKPVANSK